MKNIFLDEEQRRDIAGFELGRQRRWQTVPSTNEADPRLTNPVALRSFRRSYLAFTELVNVLAAGESHELDKLVPPLSPMQPADDIIARLAQYGALTRIGDVITGQSKRAKKLTGDEAEFCKILGCEPLHVEAGILTLRYSAGDDLEPSDLGRALAYLYDLLGERILKARYHISKMTVYRYRAYCSLSEEVRQAMTDADISVLYSYAIWRRAADDAGRLEFLKLVVRQGLDHTSAEYGDLEGWREHQPDEGTEPDDSAAATVLETNAPLGVMPVLETVLKVSMATLDIVSKLHAQVNFLARELGYQEKKQ